MIRPLENKQLGNYYYNRTVANVQQFAKPLQTCNSLLNNIINKQTNRVCLKQCDNIANLSYNGKNPTCRSQKTFAIVEMKMSFGYHAQYT